MVPAVAVTVTVELIDVEEGAAENPPPQPISSVAAAVAKVRSNRPVSFSKRRMPLPNEQIASTTEIAVQGRCRCLRCSAVTTVLMVSVVLTELACGVSVAGEKLQLAPLGNPEQAKDTV
jgi:hypothetical protein